MPRDINILIAHPANDYNCGDLLTYTGTKALLNWARPETRLINYVQFDFARAMVEADYVASRPDGVDVIVLAGTPWLWDNCEDSQKYEILYALDKRYPNASWIGLGLGSCYPKAYAEVWTTDSAGTHFSNMHLQEKSARAIALFKKFKVLLVRDMLAEYVFNRWEIPVRYTYDTSIFAHLSLGHSIDIPRTSKACLVFYAPDIGLSKNVLEIDPEEYIRYQLNWAKACGADVIAISAEEYELLKQRNVKAIFATDISYLLKKYGTYTKMLSGRVHMAVAGLLGGITDITVLPVDSRYMTLATLGIKFEFIGKPWNIYVPTTPAANMKYDWYKEGSSIKERISKVYEDI